MSNNLNLTQLAANQASPEVPINDKGGELDAALTETVVIDLTNSATISAANYTRAIFVQVTPAGVGKTLTLRATKRLLLIANDGANDITVALGTTSFTLEAGKQTFTYTDGTTNGLRQVQVGGSGGGSVVSYDLSLFIPGLPPANATVMRLNVVTPFTLPASLTSSLFTAGVASTGTATFTINKNGSSVGSVAFTTDDEGVATFSSDISFVAGDILEIVSPTTQDATLADVALNLTGTRD